MVEFLKNNLRAIIIVFLVLGIIFVVANSGNNDTEEEQTDDITVVENGEEAATDEEAAGDEATDEAEASEEATEESEDSSSNAQLPQTTTESEVTTVDERLVIVAVTGDNLSTMSRKVVAAYLAEQEKELSVGQLLFMETNLVREAGARDAIAVGEEVSVPNERLAELLAEAENLSQSRIAAWESYL